METKKFGNYIVYSDGRVFSVKRNVFLKPFDNEKGYKKVTLSHNGKAKIYKLHRLLAECFIPKIEGKNQVNHKNGIKIDNRVENLEWCNNSENQKHSWAMGLIKSGHAKVVLDTKAGVFYESASELANLLGVNKVYFIQKLNGLRKNNTHYVYV